MSTLTCSERPTLPQSSPRAITPTSSSMNSSAVFGFGYHYSSRICCQKTSDLCPFYPMLKNDPPQSSRAFLWPAQGVSAHQSDIRPRLEYGVGLPGISERQGSSVQSQSSAVQPHPTMLLNRFLERKNPHHSHDFWDSVIFLRNTPQR